MQVSKAATQHEARWYKKPITSSLRNRLGSCRMTQQATWLELTRDNEAAPFRRQSGSSGDGQWSCLCGKWTRHPIIQVRISKSRAASIWYQGLKHTTIAETSQTTADKKAKASAAFQRPQVSPFKKPPQYQMLPQWNLRTASTRIPKAANHAKEIMTSTVWKG